MENYIICNLDCSTDGFCTNHFQLYFGTGVYTGMYVAQNYPDVPKVDEPEKILEKVQNIFAEAKKEIEEQKKKSDK